MTFNEALNDVNAKIKYIGGLEAIAPYIPFPIETIKEKIQTDTDAYNKEDNDAWTYASGFAKDPRNGVLVPVTEGTIRELYEKNGINAVSVPESKAILKEAARQIAMLPNEEIDKLYPHRNKRYYVTLNIKGQITVPVLAENPIQAAQQAKEALKHANTGDITCTDSAAETVKDINGNFHNF